jgi:hypothetical protein
VTLAEPGLCDQGVEEWVCQLTNAADREAEGWDDRMVPSEDGSRDAQTREPPERQKLKLMQRQMAPKHLRELDEPYGFLGRRLQVRPVPRMPPHEPAEPCVN